MNTTKIMNAVITFSTEHLEDLIGDLIVYHLSRRSATAYFDVWRKSDIVNAITGNPDNDEIGDNFMQDIVTVLRKKVDGDSGVNNDMVIDIFHDIIQEKKD